MNASTRKMLPLGVIEGFYGTPWGRDARADNVEFLAAHGYDFYVYAPKSDAGLRQRWRDGVGETTAAELSILAAKCRGAGVEFGIAFSPFEIWRDFDAAARADLRRALRRINEIGPDILCILFDDMTADLPNLGEMQADAVAEIAAASTARRFIYCPTIYSFEMAVTSLFATDPFAYLRNIGARLDPAIDIFWTGPNVRSLAYPADHLDEVAGLIGRAPFLWDNHLANDGADTADRLFLDTGQRRGGLTAELTAGCAVNPMNQPYLSRIPLHAIATGATLQDSCRAVCGARLGDEIAADADLFQMQGRAKLTPARRISLAEKYAAFPDHPCATELTAWLRGGWAFDPACLATSPYTKLGPNRNGPAP